MASVSLRQIRAVIAVCEEASFTLVTKFQSAKALYEHYGIEPIDLERVYPAAKRSNCKAEGLSRNIGRKQKMRN